MSGLSLTKNKLSGPKEKFSVGNLPAFLGQWFIRNKFYFLAFAVPVIIMYVAYAIFGITPFGDQSVLVLDLNGQYVYYFEAIRDAFWGEESVVYNWSRNLSGGYMGVIGYYLASPFTLIPILLPRTMLVGSLLIMILVKVGLASVTFSYFIQKSKNVSPLHSVIFGSLYALCAYGVIQAMNPMWLDGVYLLPLVMLGVEYLIDDGRKLNLIIPLALIFIFNFYIGYIVAIFTALYFLFYLFSGRNEKGKAFKSEDYLSVFLRAILAVGVALLCSAFMILCVYNALALGKFEFSEPDFSFSTQFNPIDFFPQLLPAQYDTVDVPGMPEIYSGMLTLVLLPLFYLNSKISLNKKIGYSTLLIVLFLCMYINPIDMVWHGFQEPNWLPYRYSFTFSFLIVTMGTTAFTNLDGIKVKSIGGSVATVVVLIALTIARETEHITTRELIYAAIFTAVYCVLIAICCSKPKLMSVFVPVVLILVCSVELCYNATKTFSDEDKDLIYSKPAPYYAEINNGRAVVDKITEYHEANGNANDGFFRMEKSYHRTVNDASAFQMKGVTHSSSVMNAKILKFLETMGFATSTYSSRYKGGTPISDSLLGIKYNMDKYDPDDPDARRRAAAFYEPLFQYEYVDDEEDTIRIDTYQNPYALSVGYAAGGITQRIEAFGNDNIFNSQNVYMSAVAGCLEVVDDQFANIREYFKRLEVDPNEFILSNVTSSPYGDYQDHIMYTASSDKNLDPVVNMRITAPGDGEIYAYFKTDHQKKVNLWLSDKTDADGNYIEHYFLGEYFEHENNFVLNLGERKAGEVIELRMTVANEYTIIKDFQFYQFDEELFAADMAEISKHQWNITDYSGNKLKGTIDVNENQILLTSIPYEDGWSVKVDGKSVDFIDKDTTDYLTTDQCFSEYASAFIGVKLTPGTHTVEMTYTPPGLIPGFAALIVGLVCVVFIYRYDKKHNKVIIAMYRAKNASVSNNAQTNTDTEKNETLGETLNTETTESNNSSEITQNEESANISNNAPKNKRKNKKKRK